MANFRSIDSIIALAMLVASGCMATASSLTLLQSTLMFGAGMALAMTVFKGTKKVALHRLLVPLVLLMVCAPLYAQEDEEYMIELKEWGAELKLYKNNYSYIIEPQNGPIFYNPDNGEYPYACIKGLYTKGIYIRPSYVSPQVKLVYEEPRTITNANRTLVSMFKQGNPKIWVTTSTFEDEQCVEIIEAQLSKLGFNVLSSKQENAKSQADIIVEASWLHFSDPEMWADLNEKETEVSGKFKIKDAADTYMYLFKSKKDAESIITKNGYAYKDEYYKLEKKGKAMVENIDMLLLSSTFSGLEDQLLKAIKNDEVINKNRNVISAIFKVVNAKDGAILGTFHIGGDAFKHDLFFKLSIPEFGNFADYSCDRERYKIDKTETNKRELRGTPLWLWPVLNQIPIQATISEMPYAIQLNAHQDVKISSEQTIEESSGTSRTTGSGSYSGYGHTDYYRWFNSSYYSGWSSSNSTTTGSSITTTTIKDAEWIRCSDFNGYYRLLAEKFGKELLKLME